MFYFLFFTALLVCAVSGFYWRQDRNDPESVKIYRTVTLTAALLALLFALRLAPESFWDANEWWIEPAAFLLPLIGILPQAVRLVRKRKEMRRRLFAGCVAAYTAVAVLCGVSFFHQLFANRLTAEESGQAMQEATNRAETAKQYAERVLTEKLGVPEESVSTRSYGFVTENPPYYIVGFTYRKEPENSEKAYGFHISVDDGGRCTVLRQGDALGREIIVTDAPDSSR